jgi:hypothetical protein
MRAGHGGERAQQAAGTRAATSPGTASLRDGSRFADR